MKAIIHHHRQFGTYEAVGGQFSLSAAWAKFISYAAAQEERRFFWSAISLLGHGTVFTVITMATVLVTSNLFFLLVPTCLAMAIVLVVNLAALPTKYTIPVLAASLLADLLIIGYSLAVWLQ